jgi:hypothetical protein
MPHQRLERNEVTTALTKNDWAMYSGEAVYEWFRRKTILLCAFRTIAADLETPAT